MHAAGFGALGVAVVWLAVASLTARGAQRRGQRWPFALLSGLCFPVS